ncbi:MAG: hypothetical protein M3306_05410 [Actinomycetota bacterium]|nr:hypothetical protein [Actinomycetota bacterium]
MTKTQKLRNLAEGFMAALVECGYRGPWRWAHHQWEGTFYRVWNDWEPHTRDAFPRLEVGGSANGRSSQARSILWELKRTSPFYGHDSKPLTVAPRGMTPREYLDDWCDGATTDEWVDLGAAFLEKMAKREQS